jgi:hypothetical protein
MDAFAILESGQDTGHEAGAFPTRVLRYIESLLPAKLNATAETGCGKSTMLLSNIADHHTVFCIDDMSRPNGSMPFWKNCPLTKHDRIEVVLGPTQTTLPRYAHKVKYDLVLIDGPHGWPFPELEYVHFYPHIRNNGYLIVDDVNIPTIGHMADIIAEDQMWELIDVVETTAMFRRTEVPTFDPFGDGWWLQAYNRRRLDRSRPEWLDDTVVHDQVTRRFK